jgi:DNA repair exonuclease SbcCD ATPase subunit/predicted MPP superfamily phosphohydrolase
MTETEKLYPDRKIKAILHFSDAHIRLTSRHKEYREAFDKMYDIASKLPVNETLIVFCGDLFHSKVDLSPEAVQLASELLVNLANIHPLVLIAGNHDALLNNDSRMDSVSPIVQNLKHEHIHYFKKTGLYGVGNVLFNNFSVFDNRENYINTKEIPNKLKVKYDKLIGLFHGPVYGMMTDLGYAVGDKSISAELYDGLDIVLCGDIHKAQTIYIEEFTSKENQHNYNEKEWSFYYDDQKRYIARKNTPIIRQAGSLIQQNHGETLDGHGFSVWNLETNQFLHVEIPNDYGHVTIDIEGGKLITDIKDIPVKAKIRVRCKESVSSEVKQVILDIKKKIQPSEISYVRIDGETAESNAVAQDLAALNLQSLASVDYQNQLIESYLRLNYEVDDEILATIFNINKQINAEITKDQKATNIRWNPKRFEFSNMFSYGENNVIDFGQMKGTMGLFASNASGKSSIFEALMFCIFDKSSKAFKAANIINTQKMGFSCKFTFEINGVDYTIEKSGAKDKKGHVPVKIQFYKTENGEVTNLEGEDRDKTNEAIRSYVGSYEDFILTTMSLQGFKTKNIVDMGQTDRKDLLCKFMGLDVFEKLIAIASERMKEANSKLKLFSRESIDKNLVDINSEIETREKKALELAERIKQGNEIIATINNQIVELSEKLTPLSDVPTDIEREREKLSDVIESIAELEKQVEEKTELVASIVKELEALKASLKDSKFDDIENKMKAYNALVSEINKMNTVIDKYEATVSVKLDQLKKHTDQHDFDPNCEFCVKNNQKRADELVRIKESLMKDKEAVTKKVEERDAKKAEADTMASVVALYDEWKTISSAVSAKTTAHNKENVTLLKKQNELLSQKTTKEKLEASIQKYEQFKETVQKNNEINAQIAVQKKSLGNAQYDLKTASKEHTENTSRLVSLKDQIKEITNKIELVGKLEDEYAGYEAYLTAIGKNGVPYELIKSILPLIQKEVNNILSQITDFTIRLESESNNINIYIEYENATWPVEMASGMEKFITTLALRVAMFDISNLPRPNFLAVDEGWSACDGNNIAQIPVLLSYLKTQFDFIVIISHLDQMRDFVDKLIEIKKIDGYSAVDFQ